MARQYKFSSQVLSVFKKIKKGTYQKKENFILPVYRQGKKIAFLRPLTRENLIDNSQNREIVRLLAKWREANSKWFDIFKVTEEGTRKWLKKQVIQKENRLLFILETIKGVPIGHMGLFRGEVDNVIRGRKILRGAMTDALRAMTDWAFNDLKIKNLYLRFYSDNKRAVAFYERSGFKEIEKISLKKVVKKDSIRWEPIKKGEKAKINRYFSLMHLASSFKSQGKSMKKLKRSKKKISFAGPWITQKEMNYVLDAVKHGWYSTFDMHVKKLEKTVADYLGMKYALATHCCTLALHLSCAALELKEGDEVICPDFSWIATAYPISYTGATVVFVDIDPDSWCLDPKAIKKAITKKTKAIMLVHTFGHPAQMDEIMKIARQYNLRVIEDAAPAMGAEFKKKKVGTFGDFGCFSFHGAKLTVSGEGGVLVTNKKRLYEKACLLASMGRTDSKAAFWSDILGYQYTIGNLTASIALAQVERIDKLLAKKRQIFNWYWQNLKDLPGIKLIKEKEGCKSNYCYPSLLLKEAVRVPRDEILRKLRELNVHCRPGFPRMSRFLYYQDREKGRSFSTPEAEKVAKRGICLPSAANLAKKDIDFVCQALLQIIS